VYARKGSSIVQTMSRPRVVDVIDVSSTATATEGSQRDQEDAVKALLDLGGDSA
jgi:hypothetical protein